MLLRRLARTSVNNAVRLTYERKFSADTSGVLLDDGYAKHLGAEGVVSSESLGYLASDWLTLPRILRRSEITTDDVFLDAGCGHGRILLEAASRYPFRRVIGVEISEVFAEAAEANIRRASAKLRAPVEVVRSNIVDYVVPIDVTIAYAANPFRGHVFAGFIDRLVASLEERPRRLQFVYFGPREDEAVLATGRFQKVRYGRSFITGAERHRHIVMYEAI